MRKYRLLFIGSLLLGIMVIVLTGSRFWFEDGILGSETLERLRSMDIHGSHFFMYLLVRHLAVIGVLLLLSNTMYVCSEMLYSLAGSAIWHVCSGSLHAVSASWRLIRFRKPVSTSVRADSVLCAADLLVSE